MDRDSMADRESELNVDVADVCRVISIFSGRTGRKARNARAAVHNASGVKIDQQSRLSEAELNISRLRDILIDMVSMYEELAEEVRGLDNWRNRMNARVLKLVQELNMQVRR